jgi:hypothetical protein
MHKRGSIDRGAISGIPLRIQVESLTCKSGIGDRLAAEVVVKCVMRPIAAKCAFRGPSRERVTR